MKSAATIISLLLITLVSFPYSGLAEELTPEKEAAIMKLMEITGSKNMGPQFGRAIDQNIAKALKKNNPDIPEKAFQILSEEVDKAMADNMDNLMSQIVTIYNNHFTKAEIDELLAFYATPIGKKMISVLPQILKESLTVGQTWGQTLAPKLLENLKKRFKEEGIPLPKQ